MKTLSAILFTGVVLSGSFAVAETPAPPSRTYVTEDEIHQRLDTIRVEDFQISKLTLSQAIQRLDGVVQPYGVQIVFEKAGDKDPVVNLKTRGLSFSRNLTFLCKQAGYSWSVEAGVVVVALPGTFNEDGPLVTEFISVKSPTVRRLAIAGDR